MEMEITALGVPFDIVLTLDLLAWSVFHLDASRG